MMTFLKKMIVKNNHGIVSAQHFVSMLLTDQLKIIHLPHLYNLYLLYNSPVCLNTVGFVKKTKTIIFEFCE